MGWSSSVAFTLLSEDGILVGVIVESSSFFFGLKAFMIIAPRLTAKPTICIAARPCPNMTMEAVNVVTFRVRLMRLVVNAPNLEMQIKMNTCPIAEHMPSAKMSIIHEIQKKIAKCVRANCTWWYQLGHSYFLSLVHLQIPVSRSISTNAGTSPNRRTATAERMVFDAWNLNMRSKGSTFWTLINLSS